MCVYIFAYFHVCVCVCVQARVTELQGREEEWKRERSSLQELINTLKDDRIFYKETAQKKE